MGPSAPGAGVLAPATVALMAAAQAATTRTPLATCLLLALLMNGATDGGGSLLQPEPVPQLFTFAVVFWDGSRIQPRKQVVQVRAAAR